MEPFVCIFCNENIEFPKENYDIVKYLKSEKYKRIGLCVNCFKKMAGQQIVALIDLQKEQ